MGLVGLLAFWVGERARLCGAWVCVNEKSRDAAGPGGCSIRDACLLLLDRDRDRGRNVWEAGRTCVYWAHFLGT